MCLPGIYPITVNFLQCSTAVYKWPRFHCDEIVVNSCICTTYTVLTANGLEGGWRPFPAVRRWAPIVDCLPADPPWKAWAKSPFYVLVVLYESPTQVAVEKSSPAVAVSPALPSIQDTSVTAAAEQDFFGNIQQIHAVSQNAR